MTLNPENRIYPTPYEDNCDGKAETKKGPIGPESAKNRHGSHRRLARSGDL